MMKMDLRGTEVVFTRVFEATREAVWAAMVDPGQIPRWWGPRKFTTTVDKMDVRPGGAWRFVQRDAEGNEYAFHGEYREVAPPERLVYTFVFEGMPDQVMVETTTLDESDGKTTVTTVDAFATEEARDGALASGMEAGAKESMERFREFLTER
jgi:uncharacterized protein YndB with AHSA1/START domain